MCGYRRGEPRLRIRATAVNRPKLSICRLKRVRRFATCKALPHYRCALNPRALLYCRGFREKKREPAQPSRLDRSKRPNSRLLLPYLRRTLVRNGIVALRERGWNTAIYLEQVGTYGNGIRRLPAECTERAGLWLDDLIPHGVTHQFTHGMDI
jgi:hypothetical protein